MSRRPLARALFAACGMALLVAGCGEDHVTLAFTPEPGEVQRYRYVVTATISESLDGADPEVTELTTEILAEQRIISAGDDGALAEVTLHRDGGPGRTVSVRLDRAGLLHGVDLIAGQSVSTFGLDELSSLLAASALPEDPLVPGATWRIGEAGTAVSGQGRLRRLGIVDGHDVAVVETNLAQPIDETVTTGRTTALLTGVLESSATTSHDLRDGAIREGLSRAQGEVNVRIDPPPGIDAQPARGAISYEVEVEVHRL